MTRRFSLAAIGVAALVASLLFLSGHFDGTRHAEAAGAPPMAPVMTALNQGCTFTAVGPNATQVTCVGEGCNFSSSCYGDCGYLCSSSCGALGGCPSGACYAVSLCFNNCTYTSSCTGCAPNICGSLYTPTFTVGTIIGVPTAPAAQVGFLTTLSKGTCGSSVDLSVGAIDANGRPAADGTVIGATTTLGTVSKTVTTEDGLATVRLTVDPKVAGIATVTITTNGYTASKDIVYTCG